MSAAAQETETPEYTSKKFTHETDELAFTHRHYDLKTTTVFLLRPPKYLLSTDRPWIITREFSTKRFFNHPLTGKPLINLPPVFYFFSTLNPFPLSNYHDFGTHYSVDRLLVLKTSKYFYQGVHRCTLFALYGGGLLQGCAHSIEVDKEYRISPWVKLSTPGSVKFDDIIHFQDKVYAVDRHGITKLLNYYKTGRAVSMGKTLIFKPLTPGSGRFGWRKRFGVDGETLYLVVRKEEKLFHVFRLNSRTKRRGATCFCWDRVREFGGNKVLFMARDCCFFQEATRKFPGREYKNCIVFSEAAFPQYGNDCWEFTQNGDRQFGEEDIAVFRLDDETFAREGERENSGFPKIDCSPPHWFLKLPSFRTHEFWEHAVSEPSSQSKRGHDEDEGLVESDSDSQDQEDEEMQCDQNSQEKGDEEMHPKETNIEGDNASLQKDPVTPSRSAVEEEVTRALLSMNSGNDAMEEEALGKNLTQAMPKVSTSSRTESHKSDSATTKFEGFDISSDLVPTLQKIWRNHGNIIKDSIVRSGDIVARLLESLATMVRILEDNLAQSFSDSQADYLSSTLSDLSAIRFEVHWLVSYVEKALKVHKSKSLVESLNNLSQLSSQVKERRTILLDEVSKLNEEENKLKEEMTKVSKTIPFSGQVNFEKPIGAGLI